MLYELLRPLVDIAARQFFREIRVSGAATSEAGPLLIVANHPNVILDGLLILHVYDRSIWMVAKSTIFRGRFHKMFLGKLRFVPVHRRQDNPETPDLVEKNREAFAAVVERLGEGDAVLIFPEGEASPGRRLGQARTGAARIAFQMESESNFSSGLKIQSVGITYSDLQRFNSTVTITLGEPILLAEYAFQYGQDAEGAVRELTTRIADDLKHLSAQVLRDEDVPLVEKIAKLYRSAGIESNDRARIAVIAKEVSRVAPSYPEKAKQIERRLSLYLQLCSSLKLDGSEGLDITTGNVFPTLAAPVVLLGIVVAYVPYRLVARLGMWASRGEEYQFASWILSFAFFLFPIWYAILALFCGWLWWDSTVALLAFVVFFASGYFVNWHLNTVVIFFFKTFWPGRKTPLDVLKAMRAELIDELEEFRKYGYDSGVRSIGQEGVIDE